MSADARRLQDVMIRHQAYLEGAKVWYAQSFTRMLQLLIVDIRRIFATLSVESLDALTKAQLNVFVRDLRDLQRQTYNRFLDQLLKELEAFMAVDLIVVKMLFSSLARKDQDATQSPDELLSEFDDVLEEDGDDSDGIYAVGVIAGTKPGNERLWSVVRNNPIPASGLLLLPFLSTLTASAIQNVLNALMKGYANKLTVAGALATIVGSPSLNRRDGLLTRTNQQGGAVIDTAIQHIDSFVQSAVASFFYDRYQWISVIDNATTEICRSRNRKIYRYGSGPLPPAHIHCRSKTVPYVGSGQDEGPRSYAAWIKTQPKDVQDDLGDGGFKPLSPKQFQAKLPRMLSR